MRRGESLDSKIKIDNGGGGREGGLVIMGTDRLGPDPEMVPKQIKIVDAKSSVTVNPTCMPDRLSSFLRHRAHFLYLLSRRRNRFRSMIQLQGISGVCSGLISKTENLDLDPISLRSLFISISSLIRLSLFRYLPNFQDPMPSVIFFKTVDGFENLGNFRGD
ncbi:hypothetical protein CXB51_025671 [Gossypium anomalum]|uniref:Uncharacterized protein n=1 Tax=Gossypium anomalum TaxID=47600 RepID=A0A8J5YGY0_9ROSI|nr:hypothetical protein CXB51_025671 [Gossypium anomalum]